jgi:HD-GYP domain-containing protein (c-di-GMP phosphodiesterase class II)
MNPFGVEKLLPGSVSDFDLWAEVRSSLTLYATAPYKWGAQEIERLKAEGHSTLYYFTKDQTKVETYLALHTVREIETGGSPADRIVNLNDAAAELTQVLYNHELSASLLAKGQDIANGMVSALLEDVTAVGALGKLANHDYYTYYHSARVASYALAMAMQMSLRDEAQLQSIAIGCLMHDIGKSKVDLSVLNKPGSLDPAEWEMMKKHPEFGDKIGEGSILDAIPRNIILHHHERMDGGGYPHNLSKNELLEEVKIAAFADVFDALTTNRSYQKARTKFEALDFIRNKLLKNLHRESFEAMVAILGFDKK